MAHVIERAVSGRATCRGCGERIAAGIARFGESVPNPFADGEGQTTTHWFHVPCGAYRRPEPFLEALAAATEPGEDRERLEAEAQLGVAHRRLPRVSTASLAPTGRATCRACRGAIEKGSWRIALVFHEDGRFVPSGFAHARCLTGYVETDAVLPRIRHFSPALGEAEVADLAAAIAAGTPGPT